VSSRRTLILIAAIVIGALASFLVYGYVSGVQDEAYDDAQRLEVFVVKQAVPKGTYGEEATAAKLIVKDQIPKKFYPPTAIRAAEDIGGKVAINDLAVNQIVTSDMFADPATVSSTFSDRLEKINDEDQVAVSISVDQVHGVANLLQPGDYVNIMQTGICEGGQTSGGAGGEGGEGEDAGTQDPCAGQEAILFGKQARYVYQKAQILAVDQTPVAQPGEVTAAEGEAAATAEPANRGLLTLIVPARAAQYIASLVPEQIYLTLVSRDYEPVPQTAIDPTGPLPGEDPSVLTPYGPDGAGNER
jgi:Flp pilus assembly protein CpaB